MQSHGTYKGGPQAPYVAGFAAVGEIVGVGPGIERPLGLGTHVVGTGPGAFAQYMTMQAAAVLPVPSGWSDAEALDEHQDQRARVRRALNRLLAGEATACTGSLTVVAFAAEAGVHRIGLLRHLLDGPFRRDGCCPSK